MIHGHIKTQWTKSEAASALGITPRTVGFWTDEGFLNPEIANPKGRGTTRRYSARNLVEMLVIKELGSFGFKLDFIRRIMNMLDRQGIIAFLFNDNQDGLRGYILIHDPQDENCFATLMYKKGDDLVDVPMHEGERRFSLAVVLDVTSLLETVQGLIRG